MSSDAEKLAKVRELLASLQEQLSEARKVLRGELA